MNEACIWKVKAADFRRMAETSLEAERERKLLQLAATMEEQADAVERHAKAPYSVTLPPPHNAEVVDA